MTLEFHHIFNPFFAARRSRERRPLYAKLPVAPLNASPIPSLTSLYHNDDPGDYGDRRYPGNCGGNLIKDLLRYFQPKQVFDPMTGSGTCRDVCVELAIPHFSTDLKQGFDACDSSRYESNWSFDFVWLHPPYWRQKIYSQDERDLSQAPTLERFLKRYAELLTGCAQVLSSHGRLAVLMGDYFDRETGYVPLTFHTKRIAFECGLQQAGTDIIRFSHNASSSRKVYRSSFIPGLHDVCMVFEKPPR